MLARILLFFAIACLGACAQQKTIARYTGGYTDAGKQMPEHIVASTARATVKPKPKANPRRYYAKGKPVRMRATGHLPFYNY